MLKRQRNVQKSDARAVLLLCLINLLFFDVLDAAASLAGVASVERGKGQGGREKGRGIGERPRGLSRPRILESLLLFQFFDSVNG